MFSSTDGIGVGTIAVERAMCMCAWWPSGVSRRYFALMSAGHGSVGRRSMSSACITSNAPKAFQLMCQGCVLSLLLFEQDALWETLCYIMKGGHEWAREKCLRVLCSIRPLRLVLRQEAFRRQTQWASCLSDRFLPLRKRKSPRPRPPADLFNF